MSPRWLKFLEKYGSLGKDTDRILDREELEDLSEQSRDFTRYDVLFHLYGPIAGSPWVPYQCPTLFASIDRCNIPPHREDPSEVYTEAMAAHEAWEWLDSETMVVVDLPNSTSIEIGAVLMQRVGVQFVSTFDHWAASPNDLRAPSTIDAKPVVDAMYTLAPDLYEQRRELQPDAPPVWLCDDRRHGRSQSDPTPGTFDNRYYIDDSILPGLQTLREGGIERIVVIQEEKGEAILPDVRPFVIDAYDEGMEVAKVFAEDEQTWEEPVEVRNRPFEVQLPLKGFSRSDMGGFGKMVPEQTEGSYSSGGLGG